MHPSALKSALRLQKHRSAARDEEAILVRLLNQTMERGDSKTLAEDLGVSPQYLTDVRYGRRAVSDAMLCRMCAQ